MYTVSSRGSGRLCCGGLSSPLLREVVAQFFLKEHFVRRHPEASLTGDDEQHVAIGPLDSKHRDGLGFLCSLVAAMGQWVGSLNTTFLPSQILVSWALAFGAATINTTVSTRARFRISAPFPTDQLEQ